MGTVHLVLSSGMVPSVYIEKYDGVSSKKEEQGSV